MTHVDDFLQKFSEEVVSRSVSFFVFSFQKQAWNRSAASVRSSEKTKFSFVFFGFNLEFFSPTRSVKKLWANTLSVRNENYCMYWNNVVLRAAKTKKIFFSRKTLWDSQMKKISTTSWYQQSHCALHKTITWNSKY